MAPTSQTDPNFAFSSSAAVAPGATYPPVPPVPPTPPNPPPSPLDQLVGTWKGTGFNTIWRPRFPQPPDRFLELNLTSETITFSPIDGAIPNRGFLQADINMYGLRYLQQISDSTNGEGLHIEPGIWVILPETTDPAVPPSVVRMASIPHGTAIVAQGTANVETAPTIPDINIIPFGTGDPPPPNADFTTATATFPEMNLLPVTPQTRNDPLPPGITQAMLQNPNSVLQATLAGRTVRTTTTLAVTTTLTPVPGGGTANTAFLQGASANQPGNANASSVEATFWIELVENPPGPDVLQLQYSQTVMLDFNGLHWPHVTVATLFKQ